MILMLMPAVQADVIKGNFNDTMENFVFTSKTEVPALWTGMTDDDFGFFLNGFRFVSWPLDCNLFDLALLYEALYQSCQFEISL